MNTSSKLLLLDILKLNLSYGDREFKEVIDVLKLKQDNYLKNILDLLQELDNSVPNGKSKVKATKILPIAFLEDIKDDYPEKYTKLLQIQDILNSKEIFQTVSDLQNYIGQKIHLTTKKNTKNNLINKYISHYINKSLTEIDNELVSLQEKGNSNNNVSKFLDMANEIVNSRKEKRF
ncbi:hypothetical protein [Psychrobacillus sp. NPDC096623]|uniref:hypothetical protein n=1 Tax=Psychrobacillus sp. NPDC096623 TaxID=3364492 RepID=UPI00382B292F